MMKQEVINLLLQYLFYTVQCGRNTISAAVTFKHLLMFLHLSLHNATWTQLDLVQVQSWS